MSATATSAVIAAASRGSAPSGTGVGGRGADDPERAEQPAEHRAGRGTAGRTRASTASRRRRAGAGAAAARARRPPRRAAAAAACRSAGAAPTPASSCAGSRSRSAGAVVTSGATSSASTALSTPRPSPSMRSAATRSEGEGPRSPLACTSTAGRPCVVQHALFAGGQREGEMGELPERARGAGIPARLALDHVRHRPRELQRRGPETVGVRARRSACEGSRPTRSPSTIAASKGPWTPAASRLASRLWAAASPPLPPLVETSTIVRFVSRAANTRASSSSACGRGHLALRARSWPRRGGRRSGSARPAWSPAARRRRSAGAARRRSSGPRVWSACTVNPPPAVPPRPRKMLVT